MEMLNNNSPVRLRGVLRMQSVFIHLYDELKAKKYLKDSRYVSVYENVVMFLLTIEHNCHNILIQNLFQHS